ncbi:Tyrosine-protein kinase RYK [Dirofilaria immitis]|nr:Tyrosine-protein kinase RYK [Dirofilaria immitis]
MVYWGAGTIDYWWLIQWILEDRKEILILYYVSPEMINEYGLDVQLNYVENGIVNLYSVKFPYRININISHVQFSWNTKVVDRPVHYTIRIISDDSIVIPLLQIFSSGKVPLETEIIAKSFGRRIVAAFNIEYRCTGIKTGKFDIEVNFNFDWPSSMNQTEVSLRQEKLCVARSLLLTYGNIVDYNESESEMNGAVKLVNLISAENVFYLVVGCFGAVVLVIALVIFVYYRSIRKSIPFIVEPHQLWIPKPQNPMERISSNLSETYPLTSKSIAKAAVCFDSIEPCSSCVLRSSIVPTIICEKPQVIDMKKAFYELYADRNLFQILPTEKLEGTFGEMKWALWKRNIDDTVADVDHKEDNVCFKERVIVKTLKLTADQRYLRKFLEEALAFCNVEQHENLAQNYVIIINITIIIIKKKDDDNNYCKKWRCCYLKSFGGDKIVAIASYDCLNDAEQKVDFPLICYSHHGFGNLKQFLISCRNVQTNDQPKNLNENGIQTFRAHELVSMALQILNAVIHLHNFGIIHKDIATRNCLISKIRDGDCDTLFVQICDSALSKDFFPNDYYHCLGDNENRPVKWMAYESLIHNSFNSSTDVWSFGVTLWELLTCGQQPYLETDPDELAMILQRGKRLSQPYNCPDELYGLMYCCWQLDYRDRPTTKQLLIALREFNFQLLQYI